MDRNQRTGCYLTQALVTFSIIVLSVSCLYVNYSIRDSPFSHHRVILSNTIDDVYDYVIVGGGSAGSVLASRLSEDKNSRILLLEAGGFYDENPLFHVPIYSFDLDDNRHDWNYYTIPQNVSCLGLNENRSFWPRGRVLGGSSVIHGMQYTRGSHYDYDEWAANGCKGWSYKDVLPFFLKSEDIQIEQLKSSKYHHSGGPLAVSEGHVTKLSNMYIKAGQELGFNITDYNGADQEGFNYVQSTVRNGVRESTGLGFLGRIGKRANLDIAIETFVTKVNIKSKKVRGVFYIKKGRKSYVSARKEVILSAGAINSPQLLMLSGIGPRDHLQSLDIPVIVDLPVGNNMQDHQMLFLSSKINRPISLSDKLLNSFWTNFKYHIFGTGPLSTAGSEGSAFIYNDESKRGKNSADIQFMIVSKYIDTNCYNFKDSVANEYLASDKYVEGFSLALSVTHPRSRGSLRLQSSDPFDHPLLDPRYLTDKTDIDNFIAGIRLWEKLMQTQTMKDLGTDINHMKMSFCSQYEFRSDAYWECFVRHLAVTVYHVSSTCKMGAEDDSTTVMDPDLKVKGIQGLRVVDTSVFPEIITGNTYAPVIMVAEKAADLITGKDSVKHLKQNLPENV